MKSLYKLLIFTVCLCFYTSCDNNLKEKVYSQVTQSSYAYTTASFAPVVGVSYRYMRNMISHTHWYMANETSADAIVQPANASGWDDGGRYRRMHLHTWMSEDITIRDMWNTFYQGILMCTNAINQIETGQVPAPSPEAKEAGLAELRAARAFYYWMVCDNFGDAPLITEPSLELTGKSTRKEIFDFIVSELNTVIPTLSDVQGGIMYGRFNRWAAKALLANVYLNAQVYTGESKWNECMTQCNDIINSGKFSLSENYNDAFRQTGVENLPEILFTIPFDRTLAGGNSIHMFSWHGELRKRFEIETTPWGSGSAMGVSQFIDTYNPNDTRLKDTWIMGPQFAADGVTPLMGIYDRRGQQINFKKDLPDGKYTLEDEGYRMFKFQIIKGESSNSNTDFPVFRYSQILMMKAECLLRLGQPGAGALVTAVRQRAFKDHPDLATVTDEQLKGNSSYKYGYVENYKIVDPGNTDPIQFGRMYDELGWEFAWEGYRRRDMIRFGHFTKKSWLSHKPNGDYRSVYPIPQITIDTNPKLEQNPNYK